MDNDKIALQAKIYLYHLNNSTKENGIKPTENWQVSQVTDAERIEIERNFYPTVSTQVVPKTMQEFSDHVLFLLSSSYTNIPVKERLIEFNKDATYMIAYSADRPRR